MDPFFQVLAPSSQDAEEIVRSVGGSQFQPKIPEAASWVPSVCSPSLPFGKTWPLDSLGGISGSVPVGSSGPLCEPGCLVGF